MNSGEELRMKERNLGDMEKRKREKKEKPWL